MHISANLAPDFTTFFFRDRHFWVISRRMGSAAFGTNAAPAHGFSSIFLGGQRAPTAGPVEESRPEIRKAGRLGNDRPSLGARLGVGLSKPWGVWEGGFDERLGRPPAGVGISGVERQGAA